MVVHTHRHAEQLQLIAVGYTRNYQIGSAVLFISADGCIYALAQTAVQRLFSVHFSAEPTRQASARSAFASRGPPLME